MPSNSVIEHILLTIGASFNIREAHHLYRPSNQPFRPHFVYRIIGRDSETPPIEFGTSKSGYSATVAFKTQYITTVEISCIADSQSKSNNALNAITALDFAGHIESIFNVLEANDIEMIGANEIVAEQDWDESYTLFQFTRTLEFREWIRFNITTDDIYADSTTLQYTLKHDAGDDITVTIDEP